MILRTIKTLLIMILTFVFGGLVFLVVQEHRGVDISRFDVFGIFPKVPEQLYFEDSYDEDSFIVNDVDDDVYNMIPNEGFVIEIPEEQEDHLQAISPGISQNYSTLEITEVISEPSGEKCGDYPCMSPQDFLDLYNNFESQSNNLTYLTKYVYNIKDVDAYIKQKAEERGYQQRAFANESALVWFENVRTRKAVRDAYKQLRNEMTEEGLRLHFVSGYRSSVDQRNIFKSKMKLSDPKEVLSGIHDDVLDSVLSRSAIPAYSKHHSGYAVDFGCGNDYLVFSFAETDCYAWMSANNFENTKKYGFIPSYPEGLESQGPNPEPWEFVWVGEKTIRDYINS